MIHSFYLQKCFTHIIEFITQIQWPVCEFDLTLHVLFLVAALNVLITITACHLPLYQCVAITFWILVLSVRFLFPSVMQCYRVHWLNILLIAWPMMRVQRGFVFNIAWNLWGHSSFLKIPIAPFLDFLNVNQCTQEKSSSSNSAWSKKVRKRRFVSILRKCKNILLNFFYNKGLRGFKQCWTRNHAVLSS